jgi:glycosyltransferase involved in cell wall biosynthesis
VVEKTSQFVSKVIVVDDGSTDATAEEAHRHGAHVIRLDKNAGKADALLRGIAEARNFGDYIVTLDGDGQHNPHNIPYLVNPLINNDADLVIGSRFMNGDHANIPFYRKIGQSILTFFTCVGSKANVKDTQSGFRAFKSKIIDELSLTSNGYNIESDMIYHFSTNGMRIKEVPIDVIYDVPNKHKKSPFLHGFGVFMGIINTISNQRPLLFFSIVSLITGISGLLFELHAFDIYRTSNVLPLGPTLIGGFLLIVCFHAFMSGLILNSILEYLKKTNGHDK